MIHQALPNGQFCNQRDLQGTQVLTRAYTGAQQDRCAAVATRRENDFTGQEFFTIGQLHTDRALTIKKHFVYKTIRADQQISATAHFISEVGHAGVDPYTVDDIHRIRPYTISIRTIKVANFRVAISHCRADKGPLHRRDVSIAELMHRKRTVMAVQATSTGTVGFQFFEEWQ